MLPSYLLLALLWTAYFVLHSGLADLRVKNWVAARTGPWFRGYRLFYNTFAALTLAGIVGYQWSLKADLLFQLPLAKGIGIFLSIMGLLIVALALAGYDLGELTGLQQLRSQPPTYRNVVQTGLSRYVRHPIYTGILVLVWGVWLIWPTLPNLIFTLLTSGYVFVGIPIEERKLVQEWGDSYRNYQARVPMLFPFRKVGRNDQNSK